MTLSTEADCIATSKTYKEIIWMLRLAQDLNSPVEGAILYIESQSCLEMVQNDKLSHRSEHVNNKFHHFEDSTEDQLIALKYVEPKNNIADERTAKDQTTGRKQTGGAEGTSFTKISSLLFFF